MITRIDISTVHAEMPKALQRYITKRLSILDKYIPKNARGSVHIDVILKETTIKQRKECTCEAIMFLPGEKITAKEATMNMYAAVDIVQEKLKVQLKKYKEQHKTSRKAPRDSAVRDFFGKIRAKRHAR